ncbi:unnamed protein product, partial [Ixodes hexagonus]
MAQGLITAVYLLGIAANACALTLLGRSPRNRSQALMLRCLAWSDLLALLGSCSAMHLQAALPRMAGGHGGRRVPRWLCALRVVLRFFGLSSGCVATVMAVERWLALTRPFVYQK